MRLLAFLTLAFLAACNTYHTETSEKHFYEIESQSWDTIDVYFYCQDTRRHVERSLVFGERRSGNFAFDGCLEFSFLVTLLASNETFQDRVLDWGSNATLSIRVANYLPFTSFYVQ